MEGNCILLCNGIYKSFASTRALVDVSIEINKGEIRGLIGENGSGKSTLSSIIAGAQKADKGSMVYRGQAYNPATMVQAQQQGVSMIVQEMGTVPGISVASNIFLGKLNLFSKGGIFRPAAMNRAARKILEEIGASEIDPAAMIDTLTFEDRKIVEIARAMYIQPELLIVDETTTALASKGRGVLYKIIEKQKAQNKAVLFISHDLEELMEICTHVTVLRDGVIITTMNKQQMTIPDMRRNMVGRELTGNYYRGDYDGSHSPEVVLEMRRVTNDTIIENFDLKLHKGELLGIGG
ncbi:MAG: ATP-binding cassette domain-containing protein, partial [Oscillospiraceae bacterium]